MFPTMAGVLDIEKTLLLIIYFLGLQVHIIILLSFKTKLGIRSKNLTIHVGGPI